MSERFLLEMDLMPSMHTGQQLPITRRYLLKAENFREALREAESEHRPGDDCRAVRILEIDE